MRGRPSAASRSDILAIPESALARPWDWIGGSQEEVRYGPYRVHELFERAEIEARRALAARARDGGLAADLIAPAKRRPVGSPRAARAALAVRPRCGSGWRRVVDPPDARPRDQRPAGLRLGHRLVAGQGLRARRSRPARDTAGRGLRRPARRGRHGDGGIARRICGPGWTRSWTCRRSGWRACPKIGSPVPRVGRGSRSRSASGSVAGRATSASTRSRSRRPSPGSGEPRPSRNVWSGSRSLPMAGPRRSSSASPTPTLLPGSFEPPPKPPATPSPRPAPPPRPDGPRSVSPDGARMTRRGLVLFGLMSIIWGIPYLFIRVAVEEISPAMLVLARTTIGAAILLPIALVRVDLRAVLARWRWVVGVCRRRDRHPVGDARVGRAAPVELAGRPADRRRAAGRRDPRDRDGWHRPDSGGEAWWGS